MPTVDAIRLTDETIVGDDECGRDVTVETFEAIYNRCYVELVRLAGLVLGSNDHAEEVTQDVFVSLYRNWLKVENHEAYLRSALVNRSRDQIRRNQTRRLLPDRLRRSGPSMVSAPPATPMHDVLSTLPQTQRTAIVLRYYVGMSPTEIADAMNAHPSTVRSWIRRGLKSLRGVVDHE
jgi:RNA polymerase sigma-70 factor, ECF subfamily